MLHLFCVFWYIDIVLCIFSALEIKNVIWSFWCKTYEISFWYFEICSKNTSIAYSVFWTLGPYIFRIGRPYSCVLFQIIISIVRHICPTSLTHIPYQLISRVLAFPLWASMSCCAVYPLFLWSYASIVHWGHCHYFENILFRKCFLHF